jgi:hypothetical protein
MSSNLTRIEILAANQRAFEDVFGNPFAKEPFTGHYQTLKGRGAIAAMKNNFDEGKGTRVPAAPNLMDFFCDVENLISRNLSPEEEVLFWETYLYEDSTQLTPKERSGIEQKLGKLLRARRISPVSRYFKVIRGLTSKRGKK